MIFVGKAIADGWLSELVDHFGQSKLVKQKYSLNL